MTCLCEFATNTKANLQRWTPKEQHFKYLALQGQYALPSEEGTGPYSRMLGTIRKFLAVH